MAKSLILLACLLVSVYCDIIETSVVVIPPEIADLCRTNPRRMLPHPSSCQLYILCSFPHAVIMTCRDNFVFHPALSMCVSEANYNCTITTTTPVPPTSPTPKPTPPVTAPTNGPIENCPHPNWESFFCGSQQIGLIVNPLNCTQYIDCSSDPPINSECYSGAVFNRVYGRCLPGNLATCALIEPGNELCQQTRFGTIQHPYLCNKYVTCYDYEATIETCLRFYIFDPQRLRCVRGDIQTCQITITSGDAEQN